MILSAGGQCIFFHKGLETRWRNETGLRNEPKCAVFVVLFKCLFVFFLRCVHTGCARGSEVAGTLCTVEPRMFLSNIVTSNIWMPNRGHYRGLINARGRTEDANGSDWMPRVHLAVTMVFGGRSAFSRLR